MEILSFAKQSNISVWCLSNVVGLWPGTLRYDYGLVEASMIMQWLTKLAGSNWAGNGELWLDPEGNNADQYDCELQVVSDAINYAWCYEGETKKGGFTFNESGATWVDSWHQPEPARCLDVPDTWGLFTRSSMLMMFHLARAGAGRVSYPNGPMAGLFFRCQILHPGGKKPGLFA